MQVFLYSPVVVAPIKNDPLAFYRKISAMTRQSLLTNVFLFSLCLLAASIPVSRFTISVFQFCLAGWFVIQGVHREAFLDFHQQPFSPKKILLWLPFHFSLLIKGLWRQLTLLRQSPVVFLFLLFYGVHLAGMLRTDNLAEGLSELRNKLPALLLPLFFITAPLLSRQKQILPLLFFALSCTVASLISFGIFIELGFRDVREISPFIHHIHFSVFCTFSVFILIWLAQKENGMPKTYRNIAWLMALWLSIYLLFVLKAFTGIVALLAAALWILWRGEFIFAFISKTKRSLILLIIPLVLTGLLGHALNKYLGADNHFPITPDRYTALGNPYWHDPNQKMKENGNWVYAYIAETELREAWNKHSELSFDSLDYRGQHLKFTLYRYMTAKGLRKDAEGLAQLQAEDILAIENGVTNPLFLRKWSIYPRLYQLIWELDMYRNDYNPSGHSLGQRLESLKTGLQLVSQKPWWGAGTGDIKDSYFRQYLRNESLLDKNAQITGANQLLNFGVAFGLIGLMVILLATSIPVWMQKTWESPLFQVFSIMIIVLIFSEEFLRFQTGITFFAYFYGYFVFFLKPESSTPADPMTAITNIPPTAEYRVLHISSPKTWRGGEQQVAYLLEEMQTHGLHTPLLCPKDSAMHRFCIEKKLPFFTFRRRGPANLALALAIIRLCRKEHFDFVHTHDAHGHSAAVLADILGNKTPMIVCRRVDFPVRNSWFSLKKYNWPRIRAIICISETIKKITEPSILNKQLLKVIHSGIDFQRFQNVAKGSDIRKELGIEPTKKIIGNVAALAPHKDYPTFIRTAAILLKKRKDLHFLAIGEGACRPQIEQLIKELHLQDHVTITGFRNDIPSLLPQLDAMLFTSETEGLGTSVLDAFACRVPVVATAAGGIPEMIIHEKTGLLAEIKNADQLANQMLKLLNNQALRARIVKAAYIKLQDFSREQTAQKTIQLYAKLLKP